MYLDRTPNHYAMKYQYWQMLESDVDRSWYTIGILLVKVFRNSNNLPLLVCILTESSILGIGVVKFTNNNLLLSSKVPMLAYVNLHFLVYHWHNIGGVKITSNMLTLDYYSTYLPMLFQLGILNFFLCNLSFQLHSFLPIDT